MRILWRAIVTGFGWSLGAAIFQRVQRHIGFADGSEAKTRSDAAAPSDAAAEQRDGSHGSGAGQPTPHLKD
jgi:hypothetical protein